MNATWKNKATIENKRYVCGYCGTEVTSDQGYHEDSFNYRIWLCPCGRPTFFDKEGRQYPGYPFGNDVSGIPSKEVKELYDEARRCTSAQAYTSAVLTCRKLLMHIAVEKGAPTGKPFIDYVEYLSDKNYLPLDGKTWVDHIRQKGNEATHEILLMKKKDAEDLISFTEMLLKFVYEFPAKIRASHTSP